MLRDCSGIPWTEGSGANSSMTSSCCGSSVKSNCFCSCNGFAGATPPSRSPANRGHAQHPLPGRQAAASVPIASLVPHHHHVHLSVGAHATPPTWTTNCERFNGKPRLTCVNGRHPPTKTSADALTWTCQSDGKMTEQVDRRAKQPPQVACVRQDF